MTSKIFMKGIKNGEFKRIDNAADGIQDSTN